MLTSYHLQEDSDNMKLPFGENQNPIKKIPHVNFLQEDENS